MNVPMIRLDLNEQESAVVLAAVSLLVTIVAGDGTLAETMIPEATLNVLELGTRGAHGLINEIAMRCTDAFPNRRVESVGRVRIEPEPDGLRSLTKSRNGGMVS